MNSESDKNSDKIYQIGGVRAAEPTDVTVRGLRKRAEALLKLAEKATPGPWRYVPTNSGHLIAGGIPGYIAEVRYCRSNQDPAADACLIAVVHDAIALICELLSIAATVSKPRRESEDATSVGATLNGPLPK